MVARRGLGKGKGSGYYNLIGIDPRVHSDSARGRRQPQRMPVMLKKGDKVTSRFTQAKGRVVATKPFAVEYDYEGRRYRRFSNPKYWKGGKKIPNYELEEKGILIDHYPIDKNGISNWGEEFVYKYKGKKYFVHKKFEGLGGKLESRFTNFNVYRVGKTPPKGTKIRIQDIGRKGHSLRMAYYKDGKWHTYQFLISKADAGSAKTQKLVAQIKSKYPNVRGGKDMPVEEVEDFISRQERPTKKLTGAFSDIETFTEKQTKKPSLFKRGKSFLKKIKKEREQSKIKEFAKVRPEFQKLQNQQIRVKELERQIATQEDKGMDTNKEIEELEGEMEQLRELQEKATNINVKDLSNSELKTLAIRDTGSGGFLSEIIGSGANEYEEELLRRIKKERMIDKELKKAQTEPLEDEGLI